MVDSHKRISKFPNGWYEAWVPGQYRVAYNKTQLYKVVWHSNGDVSQEFEDGKVRSYFRKQSRAISIEVKGQEAIWFFPEASQL